MLSKKPSKFGWVIEGKLAASGRIMNKRQLAWAKKHGIKSVVTIREQHHYRKGLVMKAIQI